MQSEPVGETWQYHPEYHKMASFLGLNQYDRQDYEVAKKISLLRDWAGMKSKKDSTEEAMSFIDGTRRKVGTQAQGKTLVEQLFQHARLEMDRASKVPLRPNGTPQREEKKEIKSQKTQKPGNIQQAVQQAVQGSIAGMVKNVMSDKKLLSNTIQQVVKESIK